jgi:hypothetical protein
MKNFTICSIDKKISDLFVKTKHYSRRSSMFQYAFGLIENNKIVGVHIKYKNMHSKIHSVIKFLN